MRPSNFVDYVFGLDALSAHPLKAIFFDAAGTLIYLPVSVGEHYQNVAADFGASLDAAALNRAFKDAWIEAPERPAAQNGAREEDDKGWWRELVYQVLDQTLPSELTVAFDREAYFEAVYAHFALPGIWRVYDDVRPTLERLRARGISLAVISNFDRRLYKILEQLNLRDFFAEIIISSEVGAEKPNPIIFQKAVHALGITATEAAHVGDDETKDGGASLVGMHVFHLHRPAYGLNEMLWALDTRT